MARVQKAEPNNLKEANPYFIPSIEVKAIPSGFIPYPKGTKIYYQPCTMGELKKMSQDEISLDKKYEYILGGITVEGMDKMQLTVSDVLYLSMLRKLSIPGVDSVTITKRCKHCGEFILGKKVLLAEVEFEDLKTQLPLSVEIEGIKYSFSPLTIGAVLKLNESGEELTDSVLMANTCVAPSVEKALAMITRLNEVLPYNNPDLAVLNKIDTMLYHGVAPINLTCDHCGLENKVHLDEEEKGVLVLPFCKDDVSAEARIQAG